jgi:hypothetical protein
VIGVLADPAEEPVIREFFELFKTPWEFYRPGACYGAVLCTADAPDGINVLNAKLVIVCASAETSLERASGCRITRQSIDCAVVWKEHRIPLYGRVAVFHCRQTPGRQTPVVALESSGECAGYSDARQGLTYVRIGYDLFDEIRILLETGQPSSFAITPTLDLHIALLRELLTGSGMAWCEIPPVPDEYSFLACLTHDVDHPAIRPHRWDHTAFGFLKRAVLGSVRNFLSGRIAFRQLLSNWAAACKLPFVYLGWAQDFWAGFAQTYLDIEKGRPSTFFFVPFRDHTGWTRQGAAPRFRAVRYGAVELAGTIRNLRRAGCEVGLHGIDAWRDEEHGRSELTEIHCVADCATSGVRMHWLYYDADSPAILEDAGAAYDSTFGYNETVGYRAGTAQVYKPLPARQLLELPLHIMDTALFYPTHLGLSFQEARPLVREILENAERFGGCVTINWHDRSLAPERLWGDFYQHLLEELAGRNAWFATATDAVAWFRHRRSAVFERDHAALMDVRIRWSEDDRKRLPGLRVRVHNPPERLRAASGCGTPDARYVDMPLDETFAFGAIRAQAEGPRPMPWELLPTSMEKQIGGLR